MILVTGGTGLVGAHLLYFLLQKHDRVRATQRASSDIASVQKVFSFYTKDAEAMFQKIEWLVADVTEIPSLTEAFKGITHVYHCAAYISFDPKNYYKLKKANVEGTANVVNLCLAYNIQKLCYVSSIATLSPEVDQTAMDEESEWNPEDNNSVYAITKYGAEMVVWRGVQEGLKAVIVNPGVVLGEGYWNSASGSLIKNAAKGQKYYTHGTSGFVDVVDVVSAMILLMDSSQSAERYILVGEHLTYFEFFSKLAVHFKQKPPSKSLGKRLLSFIGALDGFMSAVFGTKRKLPKTLVESLFTHSVYDASKIENAIDFSYTPIEITLERVVQNYSSS